MGVHCSRNRLDAVTKLSRMNAGQKNSSLTPKMSAKATSCDDTQDACVRGICGVNFKISVPKEQVYFGRKELELTKFAYQTF